MNNENPLNSTNILGVLHDSMLRNQRQENRLNGIAIAVRDRILAESTARIEAERQVQALTAELAAVRAENDQLAQQNVNLTNEINTMAAAIQIANQQISSTDSMFQDAVRAIESEIGFGMTAAATAAQPSIERYYEPTPPITSEPEPVASVPVAGSLDAVLDDIEGILAQSFKPTQRFQTASSSAVQ